jgi:hypothetical protein
MIYYYDGDTFQWVDAAAGAVGSQGATGAQGAVGPQGADGSQGTQGIQGVQGTTGSQGTTGETGAQGSTGAQGIQGVTGTQGITGQTGAQGATGAQGTSGTNGSQGTTGSQGATGTQGTVGAQGITGAQGVQGTSGASILGTANTWTNTNAFTSATFNASTSTVILKQNSSGSYAGLRIYNDQDSAVRALEIDYSGSSYSGSLVTGAPAGESAAITTTGAYPLVLGTSNTARLIISSSGSVGIGTASPSEKLSVLSADNTLATNIFAARASNGTQGIGISYTGIRKITNNGSNDLNIDAASTGNVIVNANGGSGNVGINKTSPASKLYISTASTTAYGLISQTPVVGLTAGNYVNMAYFADARGDNNDGLRIVNVRDTTGSGGGNWETSSYRIRRSVDQNDGSSGIQEEIGFGTNVIWFNTNGSERARIDSSGNVGIGTSSPLEKLSVSGSIKATDRAIAGGLTAGITMSYDITNSVGLFETWTSKPIGFETAGVRRMTIAADGNVGIGTSSPTSRLSIVAATAIEDESILRLSGGSTSFAGSNDLNQEHSIVADLVAYSVASGIVQRDAGMIGFKKEGTWNESDNGGTGIKSAITFKTQNGSISSSSLNERMRITSSGNVGIGTASPNFTGIGIDHTVLSVGNSAAGMGMIELAGYRTSDADLGRVVFGNQGTRLAEIFASRIDANTSTKLSFSTADAGSMGVRMTISKTGNVGIGTTNPKNKLTVLGSIAKQTTTGYDGVFDNIFKYGVQADLEGSGQNLDRWIGADATVTAGGGDANKLKFRVYSGGGSGSPADVMTLLGNGNVGIGTVSPGSRITSAVSSGGGVYAIEATVDGTAYFQVRNNGVTYTQGGTVSVISTRDVKKNIVESPYSFDSLIGIKLRQFQYIDPLIEGRKRLGLIVDEVENILPEAMNYNDEGKADSIAYSDVALTVAVTTMHELQKVNANLIAELQSLRARVAALETN